MWWKKHRDHSRGRVQHTPKRHARRSHRAFQGRDGAVGGHTWPAETRPPRLGSDFCTVIERMITNSSDGCSRQFRGSNHGPRNYSTR